MSYRIVILNGERRGERLDMETASLTLGQSPACDLRVTDPGVALLHAEILAAGGALSIRVCDELLRIHVNNVEVQNSPLKHGDVVEIGSTRFLLQEYTRSPAWKAIAGHRKWFTVGLPILVVLAVAGVVHTRRNSTPKAAIPPARQHSLSPLMTGTNNWPDDNLVTNTPRILIDPSIVLTAEPPELVEAVALMEILKTNSVEEEAAIARMELDLGTRFLQESERQQDTLQAVTNLSTATTDLIQAETVFTNSTPSLQPQKTDP